MHRTHFASNPLSFDTIAATTSDIDVSNFRKVIHYIYTLSAQCGGSLKCAIPLQTHKHTQKDCVDSISRCSVVAIKKPPHSECRVRSHREENAHCTTIRVKGEHIETNHCVRHYIKGVVQLRITVFVGLCVGAFLNTCVDTIWCCCGFCSAFAVVLSPSNPIASARARLSTFCASLFLREPAQLYYFTWSACDCV